MLGLYFWSFVAGLPLAFIVGSQFVPASGKAGAANPSLFERSGFRWGLAGLVGVGLLFCSGSPLRGVIVLLGPTTGFLTGAVLGTFRQHDSTFAPASKFSRRITLILALVVAVLIPWQVTERRLATWADLVQRSLEEGRFVAARNRIAQMEEVGGPQAAAQRLRGVSVDPLDGMILQCVNDLRAIPGVQADALIERARLLLQLDEFDLAREELAKVPREDPLAPRARAMEGLLFQFREQWLESEAAFVQSIAGSRQQALPEANEYNAWVGAAYAARKQGDFSRAEEHYREALSHGNDDRQRADLHFLLAQLLEEAQQSLRAAEHARLAARFDPGLYADRANQLLDRLRTSHLGCFWIPVRALDR